MILPSVLLAGASVAASPIIQQYDGERVLPAPQYYIPPAEEMVAQVNYRYFAQLKALRDEGLAVRHADGGTLTPAHRADLQARLDRINASYVRSLSRYESGDDSSVARRRDGRNQ